MSGKTTSLVTVGRSENCSYVVLDSLRKVSRRHLDIFHDIKRTVIIDRSTNGTFVNGNRLVKDLPVQVDVNDLIMLADSYQLNLINVVNSVLKDSDKTSFLNDFKGPMIDSENVEIKVGEKTVVLNPDKTEIGEILSMDNSQFICVGRSSVNDYKVDKTSISKKHCRIRLIDPYVIEIEDLNSTNGTFADGERIRPGERFRYTSSVRIRLGIDTEVDLSKVLPGIRFAKKYRNSISSATNFSAEPTRDENIAFADLEIIWREYQERQQKINNSGSGIALGGSLASSLMASMITGPFAIIIGVGGSLMARYISQQQTSKLRSDFTYEDMFLQIYACPRCKESFQKKPWITIRECLKCKIKFRQ